MKHQRNEVSYFLHHFEQYSLYVNSYWRLNKLVNHKLIKDLFITGIDRSKRSLFDTMPPKLHLRVENPMGRPFELILVKAESYLANEYLPVVTHGFESNPNVCIT